MLFKFIFLFFTIFSLINSSLFEDDSIFHPIPDMQYFKELKEGKSDHLIMLYFYHKNCPNCNALKQQMVEVAENLEGIMESYHVNCDKIRKMQKNLPENQQALLCQEKYVEQLPQVIFLEPPEQKINPYTKLPMKATERPYQGEGSASAIKEFAKKYIPAYRKILKTQSDLEEFLSFTELPNKVILFTDKKETSIMFKGMTAIFRDRIDFAEVNAKSESLINKYSIQDFPTLIVLQHQESGDYSQTEYTGSIKFEKVKEFLEPFALEEKIQRDKIKQSKEKKETKEKSNQDKKSQQKSNTPELVIRKYQKSILDQDKMVLLHVYTPGQENSKQFNEIQQRFGDMIIYYTFELDTDAKKSFAEEKLFIKKSPILKLYPLGTNKKERSKIFFEENISSDEFKQEISDLIEDQSRGFNSMKDFQMYLASSFQEEKLPVIMLHNSKEASISWRVFTHLAEFTDKINFFTVQNPSQEIKDAFTVKKMPAMVTLFAAPPDSKDESKQQQQQQQPQLRIAQFPGKFKFNEMLVFFNQILGNDPNNQQQQQQQQHRPTSSSKSLHQLQSQEDFDKYCIRRSQMCFIGFLDLSEGKESTKVQSQLNIIEEVMEKFSERKIEFMWIDGLCHNYLLQRINLQEDFLPQLIYYNPSKGQYANQIGTFDESTLRVFIQNVLNGRVTINKVSEEIDIDEINCKDYHIQRKERIEQMNQRNSDLDDEILQEIMEEERLKKEQLEQELKMEKKKKKKDKKKGKKSKKEDL